MGRYAMPTPDDDASVGGHRGQPQVGHVDAVRDADHPLAVHRRRASCSSRSGCGTCCSCRSRSTTLGATEFEYGLQEGLTSVGFVVGLVLHGPLLAKLLPEPAWIIVAMTGMGICGVALRPVDPDPVAILLVMLSGFFNSPSSVARSVLLQRNTPREMRGRVFSAFYVMRDVIFLFGMAGAGLADIVDIRLLIVVASSLLFVSAAFTLVAPGLGVSTWGAAAARLPRRDGARCWPPAPVRAATLADFDRLAGRLGAFARLTPEQRAAFVVDGDRPRGPGRDPRRRARRRGLVGVLHPRRLDDRRHPGRGRLPRPVDDGAPATSSARSRP